MERSGYTLVPINLHYTKGRIKADIGLAKGKKQHDKREAEKERDWQREKQRLMRQGRNRHRSTVPHVAAGVDSRPAGNSRFIRRSATAPARSAYHVPTITGSRTGRARPRDLAPHPLRHKQRRKRMPARKILILGASYGSLLGVKLALAGHAVKLVCLPAEAALINAKGAIVRLPVKGREGLVEVNSRDLPGKLGADGPGAVDPADYDLVALAMQEPQYRSPGVRELLAAVAKSGVPCMSIMNMPPMTYLRRIPGVDADKLRRLLHRRIGVGRVRAAAHDAVQPRPAGVPPARGRGQRAAGAAADQLQGGALRVGRAHRAPARARRGHRGGPLRRRRRAKIELPVKLKVHDSVFVPLAKWAMLLAGNYRCVQAESVRSDQGSGARRPGGIARGLRMGGEALHLAGRRRGRLVPFEKYAAAALSLGSPSSAARALAGGAPSTSSASIASCRPSRRRRGCATPRWTRPWPSSTHWLVRNRRKG